MKLSIVKWDTVAYMEKKKLEPIEGSVAFIVEGDPSKRIEISVDKYTGKVKVYKAGFLDDQITITPSGSNSILIQ